MHCVDEAVSTTIAELVVHAITTFAAQPPLSSDSFTPDAGPAILLALALREEIIPFNEVAESALANWLAWYDGGVNSIALFGGLASLYAGVESVVTSCDKLIPLTDRLRATLMDVSANGPWRNTEVEWSDYDLITGPAGLVLATLGTPDIMRPATQQLALLCDHEDLRRLRVNGYREDLLRSWNYGRINTGLAHGVGGVVAALSAACRTSPGERQILTAPLEWSSHWLLQESYVDGRNLWTWHSAALEGQPPPTQAGTRQAWCYGTPGLAWALWEASQVLEDSAMGSFAERAISSFCAAFNEKLYIDDGPPSEALSICHGAAGTLAIADAFALHAGHEQAALLAKRLSSYLLGHADEIRQLAHENMTLLTGASGILAVLLARYRNQRGWLQLIALR